MTDLEKAYKALQGKQTEVENCWNYYDGEHPLKYSSERLRELFSRVDAYFSENWMRVVVDAALDRMILQGVDVGKVNSKTATGTKLDAALDQKWVEDNLALEAEDVHRSLLVVGEAFLIVWPEDGDNGGVTAYYNAPSLAHVFYDPAKPKVKEFACKWWEDAGGEKTHLMLYYPDRLEHYIAATKMSKASSSSKFEQEGESEENPSGVVPVFHFRRDRRGAISELSDVTSLQDAVNKLLSDMMIASEFGTFPQRYVISQADPGNLKNVPNEIWSLAGGDGMSQQTSVGQFTAAGLDDFIKGIETLVSHIAIISKTPKHYFYGQGGDPSGEALIAMEGPLNAKVQKYLDRVTPVWQEAIAYMGRLMGYNNAQGTDILPIWKPVQTIQPKTEAEVVQTYVNSGLPLLSALKRAGWGKDEIAQVKTEIEEAEAQRANVASALLAQARKDAEAGGANYYPGDQAGGEGEQAEEGGE